MSSDVLRNVAVHVAIVAQRDDLAWRCHANGNNNAKLPMIIMMNIFICFFWRGVVLF